MSVSHTRAILVVEDDTGIRGIVRELLDDEGYEVFEASNGAEAIVALGNRRPPPDSLCLVILDMMLPVADGVEVLNALADWGHFVPVVAVSADRYQLHRAVDAGADETLAKPYDLNQLLAVVERNCRG